jgi:hypothetical protein
LAKTKEKSKGIEIRQIKTKKERKSGSLFTRLKTDEYIKGYALFSPDPEADKNPFWFEYLEHYDKSNNQYVPCVGDDCYMCELGDNPSPRALTVFYFPDADDKDKFKVFKMNGYLIRDFNEIDEEEGGVLGRKFRIKRLSDKGEYRATPQADKKLSSKEIKALIKEAIETFKLDLEKLVLGQAQAAIKKVSAVDALTEEDDDDDEEETKTKRGKDKSKNSKSKSKDEDDDDDDDDDDEDEDDDDDDEDDDDSDDDDSDDDDDEDDDEDDDDDSDDDDDDDDDDESDDDDDEESDDDDDDEEESELKNQKVTVTSTSEKDEIISGKLDGEGKATKLYVGEGLDVDWDKVKKGAEITVSAKKDDEDDWVLTAVKVAAGKTKKDDKKKTKDKKKK